MTEKAWKELNAEKSRLIGEYAKLKNKPKPLETEDEEEARIDQIANDRHQKYEEFDALGTDFKKKRDYVVGLKKEVEAMKATERKDELEQKLKDQSITEKELLELQALKSVYP